MTRLKLSFVLLLLMFVLRTRAKAIRDIPMPPSVTNEVVQTEIRKFPGENVTFECPQQTNDKNSLISWSLGDVPLSSGTMKLFHSPRLHVLDRRNLQIVSIAAEDHGAYRCHYSAGAEEVTVAVYNLFVEEQEGTSPESTTETAIVINLAVVTPGPPQHVPLEGVTTDGSVPTVLLVVKAEVRPVGSTTDDSDTSEEVDVVYEGETSGGESEDGPEREGAAPVLASKDERGYTKPGRAGRTSSSEEATTTLPTFADDASSEDFPSTTESTTTETTTEETTTEMTTSTEPSTASTEPETTTVEPAEVFSDSGAVAFVHGRRSEYDSTPGQSFSDYDDRQREREESEKRESEDKEVITLETTTADDKYGDAHKDRMAESYEYDTTESADISSFDGSTTSESTQAHFDHSDQEGFTLPWFGSVDSTEITRKRDERQYAGGEGIEHSRDSGFSSTTSPTSTSGSTTEDAMVVRSLAPAISIAADVSFDGSSTTDGGKRDPSLLVVIVPVPGKVTDIPAVTMGNVTTSSEPEYITIRKSVGPPQQVVSSAGRGFMACSVLACLVSAAMICW